MEASVLQTGSHVKVVFLEEEQQQPLSHTVPTIQPTNHISPVATCMNCYEVDACL